MAGGAGRTGAGRWRPSPKKKLLLFLGFFRIFILPSVNLCRVLFRHSAKALPSARQKALGKIKMRKNPKNNSKIFQKKIIGGGCHQPAPARLHRSRCIFCAKFAANAAGGIRTHDPSLACLLLYHCTTLSLVFRFHYLSSYIILNRE